MTTSGYKKRSKRYRKWLATKAQQPIGPIKNPFGPLCPNGCGEPGPHFVPPSFGSPGMFICKPVKEKEAVTSGQPTEGDQVAIEKAVPVLYLDLDGTVRQGKDDALGRFVNGPEDVVVFPEAVEMMRRWKKGGGRIIGVSNQGGIALGILSMSAVAAAMSETQKQTGDLFDKIAWCSHHPAAEHPEMARCWCRKPSPGLIVEASLAVAAHYNEIYPPYMGLMVGDRPEDEGCAKAAGLDFVWAAEWRVQANG